MKYIEKMGVTVMFDAGIFVTGLTYQIFDLLNRVNDKKSFISLPVLSMIVGAGYQSAPFSIIAQEFPDNVGAILAALKPASELNQP